MTAQERQQQAADLAAYHGTDIEPWMLWEGWTEHVGCIECSEGGPAAACWGRAECHGYERGCGCNHCESDRAFNALFDLANITPALWVDPAA